jgi:hypothetical protein
MAKPQPPQVSPGVFPEPQQRAVNDALARIAVDVSEDTVIAMTMRDGESRKQISVNQSSSKYVVAVETTWWTMWRTIGKSSSLLTLEFSNPAGAGDVLTVRLT